MFPEKSPGSTSRTAETRRAGTVGRESIERDAVAADDPEWLVTAFLDGEPTAIRVVADWARAVVVHRIWGFENADDIVQATMLALVQNLREGRFKGGNLRAYVRRIAKNMCITIYRKARTRGDHVSLEEGGYHTPFRHIETDVERRSMIDRILARLDEGCRRIILLAYVQGYNRKEISHRLGISEQAARVRLYRCIRNARAFLSGPGTIRMERG